MNYFVNHGVNNSHLTDGEFFTLYRDATSYFNGLSCALSSVIFKISYNQVGFINGRKVKAHNFDNGTDADCMIKHLEYLITCNH